jgi:hypothetical protein
MAIPKLHTIKIVPNVNPSGGAVAFPLKIVCDCQWEALALNVVDARFYATYHGSGQSRRGNTYTIVQKETYEVSRPESSPEAPSDGQGGTAPQDVSPSDTLAGRGTEPTVPATGAGAGV